MLCRISYELYLSHMLDFFTSDELTNMSYAIISSGIRNQGMFGANDSLSTKRMVSVNPLYPSSDIIAEYKDYPDVFKKEYIRELKGSENLIYLTFVSSIIYNRHNIVILYRERESMYIDILTEFIYKRFKLGCINLDELFKTGSTDIQSIHRKKIMVSTEEIKLKTVKEINESFMKTENGRLSILDRMSKSEKLDKMKELGIKLPKDTSEKKITEILKEEWCMMEEEDY